MKNSPFNSGPASFAPAKDNGGITEHRTSRCSGLRHLYALLLVLRWSADKQGAVEFFRKKKCIFHSFGGGRIRDRKGAFFPAAARTNLILILTQIQTT